MKSSILPLFVFVLCTFASCSKDDIQAPVNAIKNTADVTITNTINVQAPVARSSGDTSSRSNISISEVFTVSAEVIKVGGGKHNNEWPK